MTMEVSSHCGISSVFKLHYVWIIFHDDILTSSWYFLEDWAKLQGCSYTIMDTVVNKLYPLP